MATSSPSRRRSAYLAVVLFAAACSGDSLPGVEGNGATDSGTPAPDFATVSSPDLAALGALDAAIGPGPIVRLSDGAVPSRIFLNNAKSIAIDGAGGVHAAWLEAPGPPDLAVTGRIVYRRSTDGGATFLPSITLVGPNVRIGAPKVAAAGDYVFVVWHQVNGQRFQIVGAHSADRGATFHPIAQPIGDGAFPSIDATLDGGGKPRVVVVYGNPQVPSGVSEVYLSSSSDGGATFSAPVRVSSDDRRSSWTPSVAVAGNLVHVAWTDERDHVEGGVPYDCGVAGMSDLCKEEEYYRLSSDGGLTFPGPEVRLTNDPPGAPSPSWCPDIVAAGQEVHLVYFDKRTGDFHTWYRRSRSGGATFENEVDLTMALGAVPAGWWLRPSVALRGGRVQIAFWAQAGAATTVWTVASSDDGDHFGAPLLVSAGTGAQHPAVALGADGASHLLWYDSPDGSDQVYYRSLR